jgi:MEMO1 family protein
MQIRQPVVAGMFYPSDEYKLEDTIRILLAESQTGFSNDNIFALIAPHAGYVYSGRTAAAAYNTIAGKNFNTIIIISPSHREYFSGISVYKGDAYKTPLGTIPINSSLRDELTSDDKILFQGIEGHRQEHAIEVQLPFLQYMFKDFSIVPIVIGDQRREFVYHLAEKISSLKTNNILFIASSDLSHYHNHTDAEKLDSIVERRIKSLDYETLQRDLELNSCEACGGGCIVSILKAAHAINKKNAEVLDRCDSSFVTHDENEVVGYLSAAIYG